MNSIETYQHNQEYHDLLLWHCKAIDQGIANLDGRCGERAFWELIQNARDLGGDSCLIKIELDSDSLTFSHRGEPFEFRSLLALVTQNSSKDKPEADVVGRYGTGFMTTHAFNETVKVMGPYKVQDEQGEKGYVYFNDLELNRSYRGDLELAIKEMQKERELVYAMHARQPLYPAIEAMDEENKWTRFRYRLKGEKVAQVAEELTSVEQLLPFVMVLNGGIESVEIHNYKCNRHIKVSRDGQEQKAIALQGEKWHLVTNGIRVYRLYSTYSEDLRIQSLQSIVDGKTEDVVILPPYFERCCEVENIPSLFLSFPLLGTEQFGVNFIFHSNRFHPVEKRNGIMLPCKAPSDIENEKQEANAAVLVEMMDALLAYYAIEGNDSVLTREMCEVRFNYRADDERTAAFYRQLQDQWREKVIIWKVIPTNEGKKAIEDTRVRVLHSDFYKRLPEDKWKEYEPILESFAKKVKDANGEPYLLPENDIIEWSRTVNEWGDEQKDFYITIEDVCQSIVERDGELMSFLQFLCDSENKEALNEYALFPNRDGKLCKKGTLYSAVYLDEEGYQLVRMLLGENAAEIIDEEYAEIAGVESMLVRKIHESINNTIDKWRSMYLRRDTVMQMPEEQLVALMRFCSATSQEVFTNQRGRLMQYIPRIYGKEFEKEVFPKLEDREEDFYASAFGYLVDYTLRELSGKDEEWLIGNKHLLLEFLREYNPKDDKERRDKLNVYAVMPNQKGVLCLISDLRRNDGVPEEMAAIYEQVIGDDLHEVWIDEDFSCLLEALDVQTPKAIANEIQNVLKEDIKEERPDKYRDVLMQIILKLNDKENAQWREWFDDIEAKKHTITFKMQSGPAQKSLFSLMKLEEGVLNELAEISDNKEIGNMLEIYKRDLKVKADKEARMEHLKQIGKHMEDALRVELNAELIHIDYIKEDNDAETEAIDEQCGKDIVIRKLINGVWEPVYYIEVKSKWDFSEKAHMSTRQIRKACANEANYALCCVYLRDYAECDLKSLPTDIIIQLTRVKMDIGRQLNDIMLSVFAADKKPDAQQIKLADYRTNMSEEVFVEGEPFEVLINQIKEIAKT